MNLNKAKEALRDAAFKIGSELFVEEALKKVAKIQAEEGVKGAKEALNMVDFVETLFSTPIGKDEKIDEFWGLIGAIAIIDKGFKGFEKG